MQPISIPNIASSQPPPPAAATVVKMPSALPAASSSAVPFTATSGVVLRPPSVKTSAATSTVTSGSSSDPTAPSSFAGLVYAILQRCGTANEGPTTPTTTAKNAKSEKSVATATTPTALPTTFAGTPPLSVQLMPLAAQLPLTAAPSSAAKAASVDAPVSLAPAPATSLGSKDFFTPPVVAIPLLTPPALSPSIKSAASARSTIAPRVHTTSDAAPEALDASSNQRATGSPAGKESNNPSLNAGAAPPAMATSALVSFADESAISSKSSLVYESALDQFAETPASLTGSTSLPDGVAASSQSASPAADVSKAPHIQTTIDDSSTLAVISSITPDAATPPADIAKFAAALPTFSPQNSPRASLTKDSVVKPPPLTPSAEPAKVDATSQPSTIAATTAPKITADAEPLGAFPTLSSLADHVAVSALAANNLKLNLPDTHALVTQDTPSVNAPASKESSAPQDSASQHSFTGSSDASVSSPANSPKTSTGAPFALDTVSQTNGGSTENANAAPLSSLVVAPGASPAASSNSGATSANATAQDPAASDPTTTTLPNLASYASAPNHCVSTAQLAQSGGRSEMHIAMQTDNLGAIELHARISGDTVGAAITVEKRDAHTALAIDLPALQLALSDKQLRVEQISLLHAPMHSTSVDGPAQHFTGNGQSGGRQSPSFSQSAAAGTAELASITGFSSDTAEIFDAQGRLSVHA